MSPTSESQQSDGWCQTRGLQIDPAGIVRKTRTVLQNAQAGQIRLGEIRDLALQVKNDFGQLVKVKIQLNGNWEIL